MGSINEYKILTVIKLWIFLGNNVDIQASTSHGLSGSSSTLQLPPQLAQKVTSNIPNITTYTVLQHKTSVNNIRTSTAVSTQFTFSKKSATISSIHQVKLPVIKTRSVSSQVVHLTNSVSIAVPAPQLTTTHQPETNGSFKKSKIIIIVSIALAAGFIILLTLMSILIFCWNKRRLKRKKETIEKYFIAAEDELPNDFLTNQDINHEFCAPHLKLVDSISTDSEGSQRDLAVSFKADGFTNQGFIQSPTNEILLVEESLTVMIPNPISSIITTTQDKKGDDEHGATNLKVKPNENDDEEKNVKTSDESTPIVVDVPTVGQNELENNSNTLDRQTEKTNKDEASQIPCKDNSNVADLNEENGDNENDEEEKVIVLFSYHGSDSIELTVEAGNSVTIMENRLGTGWCWVKDNNGNQGWFPTHYLQTLVREDEKHETDNDNISPDDTMAKEKKCHDFVVLHSYHASDDDELSLEKNTVVSIIQNIPTGWSWVKTNVHHDAGWFPTCYLKPLALKDVSSESIAQAEIPENEHYLTPKDIMTVKDERPKVDFIVLHSYCASNDDELSLEKNTTVSITQNIPTGWSWVETNVQHGAGWFPTCYLQPLGHPQISIVEQDGDHSYLHVSGEDNNNDLEGELMYIYAKPDVVQAVKNEGNYEEYEAVVYRASHTYEGTNENELSFKENEPILVLEETDSGWWRGSTHLGEGWFPVTYVEALAETNDTIKEDDAHLKNQEGLSSQDDCDHSKVKEDLDDSSLYMVTDCFSPNLEHDKERINSEVSTEDADDTSLYMVTDCFHLDSSTKNNDLVKTANGLTLADKPMQSRRSRRPPPRPPQAHKINKQEANYHDVPDNEGVVIFRDSGLSKIIKITNRRSTVNPDHLKIGPPPNKPLPMLPPNSLKGNVPRKPPPPSPEILQRKGYLAGFKHSQDNKLLNLPNKPPPPTPQALQMRRAYVEHENTQCSLGKLTDNSRQGSDTSTSSKVNTDDKTDQIITKQKPKPKERKISRDKESKSQPGIQQGNHGNELEKNLQSNEKLNPTSIRPRSEIKSSDAKEVIHNEQDSFKNQTSHSTKKPKPKPRKKSKTNV